MLETFSQSVDTLYGLSDQVAPHPFRTEILRLIRKLVSYDGAIFKIGSIVVRIDCESVTQHASSSIPTALLPEVFFPGLSKISGRMSGETALGPLVCSNQKLIEQILGKVAQHTGQDFGAQSLLAFGDLRSEGPEPQWIILYRRSGEDFNSSEGILLQEFWIHIARAVSFNLGQTMNSNDPARRKRAMGMLNQNGTLEAADALLTSMLKEEWGDFDGYSVPACVLNELRTVGRFRGTRIELRVFEKSGYLVCEARRTSVFNTLAPKEKKVAYLFANGISYGQIASQLGVSPHTVRNQLAQVYQKLDIHSKIELAKIIAKM
ncbi:helix-turn-helix transcriptional regulator [Noviherbaspirillum saxi]|uniref:LuxR family transcriptional regulator n=1 Tax=Noviherbaspirillum saxi TaxID=2320863 RepID=A0A3A3FZW6_9BURK|nr:helix-turn-helix transcriptional regulator [Noviherbaspirillum saxi]RJF92619.1 LuxR family transcriptional regulator [Noviherbaspirillum saxi]